MIKIVLTIVTLLVGLGLVTSSMNFGFSTTHDDSQGQEAVSQPEGQSEPTDSENSETVLSTSIQNEQQEGEETPSGVGANSEELQAVQPQQRSDTLEVSSQLGSSTVSELTQELDAAIADIKAKDPTAANISIKCTITYPPLKMVCEISWLSTAASTSTGTALQ
ncbi:hypothetical protein BH23THE1_BH23THE1_15210 [soil metagenome]